MAKAQTTTLPGRVADTEGFLAALDQAKAFLAACVDFDGAKQVRDKAAALKAWARAHGDARDLGAHAGELEIRALRRMGELAPEKASRPEITSKGGSAKAAGSAREPAQAPAEKKLLHRARTIAAIPAARFEAELESAAKKKRAPRVTDLTRAEKERQREEAEAAAPRVKLGDDVRILVGGLVELGREVAAGSVDVILTDPPYPKEHLGLYDDLAEVAARVLPPGGSAFVMVGQSYLADVVAKLSRRLTYRWTLAYLTPGGQAVQVWDRKVNTFWKPVLWFTNGQAKRDRWIGDVARSEPNDNDKRFHEWGQSESGMLDLVDRCTEPGDLVLDPFAGGGTTGLACMALRRKFVGFEIDPVTAAKAKARLEREAARG